jgi:citrate lyase beta subunit
MKRVSYAGTSFITGTDISDALLSFITALGLSGESAHISIPAVDFDGAPTMVDLVIGPASEIVAVRLPPGGDELQDESVVHYLRERALVLARPRGVAATADVSEGWNQPDMG